MQKQKRRGFWRIPELTLLAAAFISGLTAAVAQVPQDDEHGAAPVDYQQTVLDQLQEGVDVLKTAPQGVDAGYLTSFIPADNEPNQARYDLGRKLYYDKRLSIDDTVSCASCHDSTRGFGDANMTSEGVDKKGKDGKMMKQMGTRNAPTVMNLIFYHTMFWDGRSPSVEHQAMQPIINPVEMGMPEKEDVIISKIKNDSEYKSLFKKAYGHEVNYKDIGNAIAIFERTLIFMDSPFFRYLQGDENAVSDEAKAGWILFNREGRCNSCHQISPTNPSGTDNKFHNIGISSHKQNFEKLAKQAIAVLDKGASEAQIDELALSTDMSELGRFLVTKNYNDIGAFRTPILLNIGVTGPYMHDGSLATLWDVVDHYNKGGIPNLYLDGGIEPLNLTDQQVNQLVAFLFSLTDQRLNTLNQQEYNKQYQSAWQARPERKPDTAARKTLLFENYQSAKGGSK